MEEFTIKDGGILTVIVGALAVVFRWFQTTITSLIADHRTERAAEAQLERDARAADAAAFLESIEKIEERTDKRAEAQYAHCAALHGRGLPYMPVSGQATPKVNP